jgi:hypothetical protein
MTRYCFGNLPPDVYADNLEALNLLLNLVRPKSFVSTHASTSVVTRQSSQKLYFESTKFSTRDAHGHARSCARFAAV